MAFSRANLVLGHCNGYSNSEIVCDYVNGDIREIEACPTASKVTKLFPDSDDDVVVVSALRTPICKGKRGLFKVKLLTLRSGKWMFLFYSSLLL